MSGTFQKITKTWSVNFFSSFITIISTEAHSACSGYLLKSLSCQILKIQDVVFQTLILENLENSTFGNLTELSTIASFVFYYLN